MPDTMPELFTVTTDVLDDCHVACAVTFCVVLFESVAVAVNDELAPIAGAIPVTDRLVTVGVAVAGGVVAGVPGVEPFPLQPVAQIIATNARRSHLLIPASSGEHSYTNAYDGRGANLIVSGEILLEMTAVRAEKLRKRNLGRADKILTL
jgi:hypothetical protein